MKKISFAILVVSSLSVQAADGTSVQEVQVPVARCSGPVATVAITDIDCTARSCQQAEALQGAKGNMAVLAQLAAAQNGIVGIGKGIRTMLGNALQVSKCFKVFDLEKFKKRKALLEAAGQEVKPPKIDYLINGEITSVEVSRKGGALGGGLIPVVGLISTTKESAKMTADMSVISPETLETALAKTYKADSSKSSFAFAGLGAGHGGGLGGGWSVSNSLVLDTVAREVVFSFANDLAETYARENIISRPVPVVQKAEAEKASSASRRVGPKARKVAASTSSQEDFWEE